MTLLPTDKLKDSPEAPEIAALVEWIDVWDRVCDAADPDDESDLPSWETARLAMIPDFDPLDFPTAEDFSGYMQARLVYLVRDLVRATRPSPPSDRGWTISR